MDAAGELAELRALSAEVGADPSLVQAAGGNTSIKQDATMWIKASGTWLAQALERDIMVPVDLGALKTRLAVDDPACDSCTAFIRADLNPHGLRPSIETSLHAAMRQRVVVHVHCVETIAWAVQAKPESGLATCLTAFEWIYVPYRKPGLALSKAIRARLKPATDVVVLGNHGLVVAAESIADAGALLRKVVAALTRPVRHAPPPDLDLLRTLSSEAAYRLPGDEAIHATATDPVSLGFALEGTLYPDHVVFLGPGVTAIKGRSAIPVGNTVPPLVLVEGKGALVSKGAMPAVEPMARCLADVCARLSPGDSIQALTAAEEAELVDWEAERYRQSLKSAPRA